MLDVTSSSKLPLVDLPTPQFQFKKNHSEIHSEKRAENIVKSTLIKKEPSEPTQGPTYLGGGKKTNYEFRCEKKFSKTKTFHTNFTVIL